MLSAANITNASLNGRRSIAVSGGVVSATGIFAARAANAEVWDVEGKRYIDFASGIGVVATGHRHPRVMEAVYAQLECFTHTAFQVMAYQPYIELAERLNSIAPFSAAAQTLLLTTGAEAVENAVKIARMATGRSAVIAFSGAFHGRTSLTLAMTGKMAPYKRGMGSAGREVFRIPFPLEHRGVAVDASIDALHALFYSDVAPDQVAAIIIEPVQGEGGFQVAPRKLLRHLRHVCDAHGILLIADEIQSGFGRTGRMFAIEHSGVEPDLITLAKSLAGGFPLAAVLGRADIMESASPGSLGGTYGGSPIGCAAALAVMDVIEDENLLERAEVIGARVRSRLTEIARRNDVLTMANLRGLGAMIGFDLVSSSDQRIPNGAAAKEVASRALANGLIVLTCGTHGETVRILVPLTISDALLDEGLSILERALIRPEASA
ncbi:4-aminobutyrate--2-oxoglutarate transaminase [Steroidobacter sp. S1-65]|uniref:4-aminobutyrate--2-oxoglutarate transaminase n=1 Tax=Steroidobacter gossypii TaxID=2805490 RepID=A0ABS1X0C1_9GAMM|nr:4-aminobutyrate--2-oxoglutarate transaminase [Steroidobacter gossypii]MBM0106696.1 4-aminobutyrate--2-oxoglutarate transaminase [Steroidobacter gossypii]